MFSREAVQEYVKHPEKKHNKHKTIGHFATHSTKKVFMICPLCDGKHDLDECKSFKEIILQERSRFLFEQKLCYGCFSPIYASHNARNYKKGKNQKFARKGTRLLYIVIRLKIPKKNLKRVERKRIMSKRTFSVQQWT